MTDELEKLQRKGTKPTCPHCHATVLSTSQPNLMGTTPELQKMYDEFGGENLPNPETMLAYASILEKPQYHVDKNGRKWLLATGEIIEAACAALRRCAALAATPAVGGERETIATIIDPVAAFHHAGPLTASYKSAYAKADAILALAAPPASPLRGRELAEAGLRHAEGLTAQLAHPDWKPNRSHVEQARNTIKKLAELISPPEQTAAVKMYRDALAAANVRIAELEDRLWKALTPPRTET